MSNLTQVANNLYGHREKLQQGASKQHFLEWQIRTFGFLWHTSSIPGSPFVNTHTHYLGKSYRTDDLQIVLPLPRRLVFSIMMGFACRLKKGEKFRAGERVTGITNCNIQLISSREDNRPVLRLLFPDKAGNYPNNLDASPLCQQQARITT